MIDMKDIATRADPPENCIRGLDGVLRCAKCGGIREMVIMKGKPGEMIVHPLCSCMAEERDRAENQKRRRSIERNRKRCFDGSGLAGCTFGSSEWSEHLWKAKRYADNFEAFYKRKTGLLLYGSVGTGKTHVAACVANALIDKGYKVRMTNFGSIVNNLQESFQGRQKYIDDLAENYNLLIIDDLGAERQSEFMKEQIFNVIDSRYRSGKPMIVTTNLTSEQLKKPEDVASGRIYDRILERCHPLKIDGESMRRKKLREDFREIEAMLKGEKQ